MTLRSRFIVLCSSMLIALCLALVCCSSGKEDKPVSFSFDEPVPVGPYTMTVVRSEDLRNTEDNPMGSGVAVIVTWQGFAPGGDYDSFLREFTRKRLAIIDGKGTRYKPSSPMMPAGLYYMADLGFRYRVVLFEVPRGIGGLTLIIENPEAKEKQPRFAAVNLGL